MKKLRPTNKHAWIRTLEEANPSGTIQLIGSLNGTYRLAQIIAIDETCPEAAPYKAGDVVLYDTIGAVEHRLGADKVTTVKILNFLGVITDGEA